MEAVRSVVTKFKNLITPNTTNTMNSTTQVLKAMKPHIPMIKFRGGGGGGRGGASQAVIAPSIVVPTKGNVTRTATATNSLGTIEDWQLPSRYRRRPLSEEEVSCINSGGAY